MGEEVKTEQIKVAGVPVGVLMKIYDKVGLATILLGLTIFGGYKYVKYQEGEDLKRQVVMIKKMNKILKIVASSKGCVLDLNNLEEEDKIFDKKD
jgi:hypothetical protein